MIDPASLGRAIASAEGAAHVAVSVETLTEIQRDLEVGRAARLELAGLKTVQAVTELFGDPA